MNKQRRKSLQTIIDALEVAKNEIEIYKDEEQDYYDNMPEPIQSGEKGDLCSNAITSLEEAIDNIDSSIENITEAL